MSHAKAQSGVHRSALRTCPKRTNGFQVKIVKGVAIALVTLMLLTGLSSFYPDLGNASGAISQSYTKNYRNDADINVPEPWITVSSDIPINYDVTISRVDVSWSIKKNPGNNGRKGDMLVDLVLYDTDGVTVKASQSLYNNWMDNAQLPLTQTNNNVAGFAGATTEGTWKLEVTDWWGQGLNGQIDYFDLTITFDFSVDITNPGQGEAIWGTYLVKARVENTNSVELWMDGSYVSNMVFNTGNSRWEYGLDTTGYRDGVHNLQVVATDSFGTKLADQMGVTVDNYNWTAQTVIIWSPSNAAPLIGAQIFWVQGPTFTNRATLTVDGIVVGTNNAPILSGGRNYYNFNLDTKGYSDGFHIVTGTAYDPDGNFGSQTLNYQFKNWAITVDITSPITGSAITGPTIVSVIAVVTGQVSEGRLYVDDMLYQVLAAPVTGINTFSWNTNGYSNSVHNLRAEFKGPNGNTASDSESPTLTNYVGFYVSITSHVDGGSAGPGWDTIVANTFYYALKGELYVDGTFVSSDNSLDPFNNFQLPVDTSNYRDGSHTIMVRAYDPNGNMVQDSKNVIFDNWAIWTSITSPSNGDTINWKDLNIVANVPNYARYADLYLDGNWVKKVDNSGGATQLIFTINSEIYGDGDHVLEVVAYDPDGASASSSVSVTFNHWDIIADILQPVNGQSITTSPNNVFVSTRSYSTKGEIYIDNVLVNATSNFWFTFGTQGWYLFSLESKAFKDGLHTLTARCYDPDGNFAVDTISLYFDNYRATVDITAPIDGASGLNGTNLQVIGRVTSTTSNGVSDTVKGELYVDDKLVSTIIGAPSGSPTAYTFTFDSTKFSDTSHFLMVIIYDKEGTTSTHTHSVTFGNFVTLSATLTSPADGSTIGPAVPTMNIRVTVQWFSTMAEFFIDDVLVGTDNTITSNRFDYSVDTRLYADGTHYIKAKVYDPDGKFAMDTHTVTFNNFDVYATLNRPADGSTISPPSSNMIIEVYVPSYATKAEFFIDDVLVGTDTTMSAGPNRFDYTVNTRLYKDGTHYIKAKVYDPDGNFAFDTHVVTFSNYNLGVTITAPALSSRVGGSFTVTAQISDTADMARLYIDNSLLAQSNALKGALSTYSFTVDSKGFADGNHVIRVETSYSISGESAYDSRAIQFDNTAPDVSSLSVIYLNGLTAIKASGDKIVITARVSDATSGISQVTLDASNIGGGSSLTMFDDGSHKDGEAGDGVYGSDQVPASGKMGHMRVFVNATDIVGNKNSQSISVLIDDHVPIVTNTYIIYPAGQTAAKIGDDIRVIAKVVDTTVFVDTVLVMDTSGSMLGTPLANAKTAAKTFVDSTDANDQTAVYSFDNPRGAGTSPQLEIAFTTNKNNVKNTINGLVAQDWTPLYDTVFAAIQYAKTSNNMPVVVVLTDGVDCLGTLNGKCNKFSTHPIKDVKYASIPIFTIGLDNNDALNPLNETALKEIADTSNGGAYYHAPLPSDLQKIYETIAGKIEEFEVGGISSVEADLTKIDSGNNIPLYDDGQHGDGQAHDNVFGSDMVMANSLATDEFNYTIDAVDVGGNTAMLVGKVWVDNTPPTITNVAPQFSTGNWWVEDGDSIEFTASISDPGNVGGITSVKMDATTIGGSSGVILKDDGTGGDSVAGDGIYTSTSFTVSTGLSTGIRSVVVTAYDIAMNSASGAGNIYVDNHRPMVIELVNPDINEYIEGTYTFQMRTNDVGGIDQALIKIDTAWNGMAYNAQSSYFEYIMDTTIVDDGAYLTSVQVTDLVGRVNNGPADQQFYIDNTPPNLILVFPTDGSVVNGQVQIDTIGTTDLFLAAIEYKVDDLAWTPIGTLWNTSKMVDGEHTLTIRASDNIGHQSTRTIHVTVDNGNPEAYFVTPITGDVLQNFVTIQIKATDLVKISSVNLTGAIVGTMEYNSGTGYYEYEFDTTVKADGTYSLGANVKDLGGHILTMPSVTFSIDNIDPIIKVIKPINNAFLKGNVSCQLNVTDDPFSISKLEWKVDEGSWKTLSAQTFYWNTTTYSDAKHTLWVRATDRGDHVVMTSVPVTIDNNPPTIELAVPVNNQMIDGTYVFKMHAYDTVGINKVVLWIESVNNYTIINNIGTSYFEQPIDTTTIKDGTYNIQVTAYDLAGYMTATTKIKVKVDNHAPTLVVSSPTDNEYISGDNFTVSGQATDIFMASLEYSVDSFGTRPINQSLDTTLLADGEHVIEIIAKDQMGHVTTRKVKVFVDNEKPNVSPVSPQQLEPVSGRYTFRVRAEDINGIDSVRLVYSNISLNMFQNSITGYFEVTRDTSFDTDGPRTFVFSVFDRSGKSVNLTIPSLIDNSAPNITVLGPDSEAKGVIKFRVKVEDASGLDSVLIRIGGGDWREMRNENGEYQYRWRSTYSDNGPQPYDIKVVDKLSNEEIYTYDLDVNNPSGKQNYDWLWWILFVMLIVCMVAVALTSRSSRTTQYRDQRPRQNAYSSRMAAEDVGDGVPMAMPGRRAGGPGTGQALGGQSRELGSAAHRVAMKKLEEDVVVSTPTDDEVTFMADDDMAQPPAVIGSLKMTDSMEMTPDEDVEFMPDEPGMAASSDDVSFEPETLDDVSFSEDSADDVSFSDDSNDDVSFDEDGADDVSFSDDSTDDVQFTNDSGSFGGSDDEVDFLDDSASSTPSQPAYKVPERRVPVALTPRVAKAAPVMAKKPTPTVSKSAIKGIDDLLSDSGPKPYSKPKTPPAKAKTTKSSDTNPLGDLIGDI